MEPGAIIVKPPNAELPLALAAGLVVLLAVLPRLSLEVPPDVLREGVPEVLPDIPPVLPVLPEDVLPEDVLPPEVLPPDELPLPLAAGLVVLLDVLPLLSLDVPPVVALDGLVEAPPDMLPDVPPAALPPALAAGLVVLLEVLPLLSLEVPPVVALD